MIQLFVNREEELQFLENHFSSKSAELIVIYGRRRVGKTELCSNFSKAKPRIYFLADRRPESELLQDLKLRMSDFLRDESFAKLDIKNWIELFQEFWKWRKNEKTLIILDEFPMLIEGNHAIPSIFQKIWDLNLKDKHVMLIILGSSVGMMETEVLGYKSPLYGRRTGQWKLEPLKLPHLKQFFPNYNLEELINVYGCLGGIPAYLQKFDPHKDFWQNCEDKILKKGEFLYEEAEFLLREELREPRNYSAILKAIAQGAENYGEILNLTNMDKSILSKYTSVLEDLGFIQRTYPIGIKPKPRKGHYTIADNYLKFWYKYIFPNKAELEIGNTNHILNKIKEDYNTYLGSTYEQAARELLTEMKRKNQLPFTFQTIGKWWHKDTEIDLIALDQEKTTATFIEVKWSTLNNKDCQRILSDLEAKASAFRWPRKQENYAIIAKKITHKKQLQQKETLLLDLDDFKQL
ncbi:MAG TPA: ATP-binding protein [Candidatus Bathyarchaeia archaeon]|nr:ATP-binding protein [Candidatus Bathyarchaeia archaeon]